MLYLASPIFSDHLYSFLLSYLLVITGPNIIRSVVGGGGGRKYSNYFKEYNKMLYFLKKKREKNCEYKQARLKQTHSFILNCISK